MKTTDLSTIMRLAWRVYHTTRQAFAEGLKVARRKFNLVRRMQNEGGRFYFRKVDGTLREAWGTLRPDLVPASKDNDTRKKNDTVQVYFDTERQEWRCFKRLNLETI